MVFVSQSDQTEGRRTIAPVDGSPLRTSTTRRATPMGRPAWRSQ